MSRKIRASITISASIDLDEFNVDVDEISDTLREYLEDLLFDVEGIKPARISVRMAHE
jgi:hypothetical protein|tara:strand:- start:56 stop:229 length:174 start_codon:yes stop_codon:yes gene_type:complete